MHNKSDSTATILDAIRGHFDELNRTDGALTVMRTYFAQKLEALEGELAKVIAARELYVDEEHLYLIDAVLDALAGRPQDTIRAVHRLSNNRQFLEVHELQWLQRVHERVEAGAASGIRRLLLYRTPEEIEDEVSMRIIAAHHNTKPYDYRLLAEQVFDRLMIEYGAGKNVTDFAIYSDNVLFKVIAYGEKSIAHGSYSLEPLQIQKFGRVHEQCWQQGTRLRARDVQRSTRMRSLLYPKDPSRT